MQYTEYTPVDVLSSH